MLSTSNRPKIAALTIFEIVFIAVVSVALGVAFWGWNFIYLLAKPILKLYGVNYLSAGFWILVSVFLSGIIRKPGVAIIASVIAAAVEATVSAQWGIMSLAWGFVQGLGAELIFFIFMYRKWNLTVLILASVVSSFFSYLLDYFLYAYFQLSITLQITQLISFFVSSIFLSGFLADYLIKRLLKIGVLNNFLIAKDLEK
jgi:energy-coupling factor transport system substrate-specific component